MLGKAQRICDYKGNDTIFFGDSSSISTNLSPIWRQTRVHWGDGAITWGYTEEVIHKHNTIFTKNEDFGLCDDSQPVPGHQPTTLSAPRTMFLYDLLTHMEIDIYGHIFYLLKKSIEKQNS